MKRMCLFCIFLFLSVSCSLKYSDEVKAENKNPEFVFSNTKVVRYTDKIKTTEIDAKKIEQYKDTNASYAQDVQFQTFNKESQVDMEGSCGLLMANTDSGLYELYDSIKLYSKEHNVNFFANVLKYNSKNEQLTGSRSDTVHIEKGGTVIYGSGFSASGINGEYSFSGTVSGEIESSEEKEGEYNE